MSLATNIYFLKRSICWTLYIGLTATGFLFVQKTVEEFLEGKTYYHPKLSSLTAEDMPTLTICMDLDNDMKYHEDFDVLWDGNSKRMTYFPRFPSPLEEGENVIVSNHGKTHHFKLQTLEVEQFKGGGYCRKCVKISRTEKGADSNLDPTFGKYMWFIYFYYTKAPQESILYFTSEENAYGAVFRKWHDGRVDPYVLKNGTEHFIDLEVQEFHHLPNLCREQSYYQCLATKFSHNKTCNGKKCSPFTLPADSKIKSLISCNTTEERLCQREVISSLYQDDNVCPVSDTMKSCVVREFKAKDFAVPVPLDWGLNGFSFRMTMDPPTSSRDNKVSTPVKTVFTEYYLMEWLDLVGIIGGTLGLMIGFSFMGSVTSVVDMIFDFKQQNGVAKKGNKPKSRATKIRNRHRKFFKKVQNPLM